MILARFLSEGFRQSHPGVVQQFGETLEAINPAGYIGACAALREADLRGVVSAIRVPSLIIAGELDEATPVSQAQELQAAIAGSELVVLREVAHLSNVEQPAAFTHTVRSFLVRS
jgi:3-oxoadipate enol-lactonase